VLLTLTKLFAQAPTKAFEILEDFFSLEAICQLFVYKFFLSSSINPEFTNAECAESRKTFLIQDRLLELLLGVLTLLSKIGFDSRV